MAGIFATPVQADFQRTKIAVLDFVMIGEKMEPEGIGTILSEWFITSIVKSGRFDVVERAMLQKIIAEQNLSTTGLVDESTASELGKLLGVNVIITGSILKLKDTMDINARIISVQSGSIIAAENISSDTDKDYHGLVKQLTTKIMQNFPLTGYIVKKDKKTATIDLGSMSGLASGIDFVVYKEGEVIKHPKTGEVLDVEQILTGQIRITKVSKNVAIGDIISEEGDGIEYGHLVKSIQNSDAGTVKSTSKPQRNVPAEQPAPTPAPALAKQSAPPHQILKAQTKKAETPDDNAPVPTLAHKSAPPAQIHKGQAKKVIAPEPAPAIHTTQQAPTPAPALASHSAPPVSKGKTNQKLAPEPAPANEKTVALNQPSEDAPKPAAKADQAPSPTIQKSEAAESVTPPPQVAAPAPAAPARPREYKAALFPWDMSHDADTFAGILTEKIKYRIDDIPNLTLARSYYQVKRVERLSNVSSRQLLSQSGPNLPLLRQKGEELGVNVAILGKLDIHCRWSDNCQVRNIDFFIVDLTTGNIHKEAGFSWDIDARDYLEKIVRKGFVAFASTIRQ